MHASDHVFSVGWYAKFKSLIINGYSLNSYGMKRVKNSTKRLSMFAVLPEVGLNIARPSGYKAANIEGT